MKVNILIPTKDTVPDECLAAIHNQDFSDYSVTIRRAPAVQFTGDPEANKALNIAANRNAMRKMALASDAEWFFWVDSDVIIPPNAVSSFLKLGGDFMGGWYKKVAGNDWVAARWVEQGVLYYMKKPQLGIFPVDMIGLGCAFMSRRFLEQFDFHPAMDRFGVDVYGNRFYYAECLDITGRAVQAGVVPRMLPDVVCRHLDVNFRERLAEAQKIALQKRH